MNLVEIHQLRNYSKCSNFAKYSWHVPTKVNQTVARAVIESSYRDLAVLSRNISWKTIRDRVHHKLVELEPSLSNDEFYSVAVTLMGALRTWYLAEYRDCTDEAICNVILSEELNNVKITGTINVLLIGKKITLIEFTNEETAEDILRDIGIRTKVYLLGKQNIKVNKILAINCSSRTIKTHVLKIDNPDNWNYKTHKSLQLMTLAIKNKIFYPSPTSMCITCKYKDGCSW